MKLHEKIELAINDCNDFKKITFKDQYRIKVKGKIRDEMAEKFVKFDDFIIKKAKEYSVSEFALKRIVYSK
jgi:hypothetical protein